MTTACFRQIPLTWHHYAEELRDALEFRDPNYRAVNHFDEFLRRLETDMFDRGRDPSPLVCKGKMETGLYVHMGEYLNKIIDAMPNKERLLKDRHYSQVFIVGKFIQDCKRVIRHIREGKPISESDKKTWNEFTRGLEVPWFDFYFESQVDF